MLRLPPRPGPRRAVAAVELGLMLSVLLVVLVGIWEIGRLVQVQQVLKNAAREGARLAAQGLIVNREGNYTEIHVHSGDPSVEAAVRNYLREAGLTPDGLEVSFRFTSGDTARTEPYQATKGQR